MTLKQPCKAKLCLKIRILWDFRVNCAVMTEQIALVLELEHQDQRFTMLYKGHVYIYG